MHENVAFLPMDLNFEGLDYRFSSMWSAPIFIPSSMLQNGKSKANLTSKLWFDQGKEQAIGSKEYLRVLSDSYNICILDILMKNIFKCINFILGNVN